MILKVATFICLILASCQHGQKSSDEYTKKANMYLKDGLLKEAITGYEKAIKLDPENTLARRNLGFAYFKLASYSKAIFHFEKIADVYEKDFGTNFVLATIYKEKKIYDKAMFYFQLCLKIKKSDEMTMLALAEVYHSLKLNHQAFDLLKQIKNPSDYEKKYSMLKSSVTSSLKKEIKSAPFANTH